MSENIDKQSSEKWRDYKYSEPAIKRLARKVVHRRLAAFGAAHSDTIRDIEQELALVWLNAVEKYDPNGGASFMTFLHTGMIRHVNRYIQKQYERQPTTGYNTVSLDAGVYSDGSNNDITYGGVTYGEIITDDTPLVETEVEQKSCYNLIMRNLFDRAKLFIQILADQPLELLQALDELDEKAKYAKSLGFFHPAARRITAHMVFTIMGAEVGERHRIIKEIRGLINSIDASANA